MATVLLTICMIIFGIARIAARQQQSGLQRLDNDDTVTPSDSNKSTDKPLTAQTPSSSNSSRSNSSIIKISSSNASFSGSIRVGMSRNIKVKPLHPNVHLPT